MVDRDGRLRADPPPPTCNHVSAPTPPPSSPRCNPGTRNGGTAREKEVAPEIAEVEARHDGGRDKRALQQVVAHLGNAPQRADYVVMKEKVVQSDPEDED